MNKILTVEQVAEKSGFNIKQIEAITERKGFLRFEDTEFGIKAFFEHKQDDEIVVKSADFTLYI